MKDSPLFAKFWSFGTRYESNTFARCVEGSSRPRVDTYSHLLSNLQHEAARALDESLVTNDPVEIPSCTAFVLPFWAAKWQQMLTALNRNRLAEEPV